MHGSENPWNQTATRREHVGTRRAGNLRVTIISADRIGSSVRRLPADDGANAIVADAPTLGVHDAGDAISCEIPFVYSSINLLESQYA